MNAGVIYLYTTDSQLISIDPNNGLTEIGFPIADKLDSGTFTPANAYVTWHNSGSADKALFVADGQSHWYRMCPTPAPETGVTWSPKATIVSGMKCVKSIETSPGIHQLLVGPSGTGPILYRDLTVHSDDGQLYAADFTIGSLVLAHPGQLAALDFITTDAPAVGTPLVPSVLLDEIEGTFERLPRSIPDTPMKEPSRSLYATRFYFDQSSRPAVCRHMQLKVSWPAENKANELYTLTVYGGYLTEK